MISLPVISYKTWSSKDLWHYRHNSPRCLSLGMSDFVLRQTEIPNERPIIRLQTDGGGEECQGK
jgi:hypothetical protein